MERRAVPFLHKKYQKFHSNGKRSCIGVPLVFVSDHSFLAVSIISSNLFTFTLGSQTAECVLFLARFSSFIPFMLFYLLNPVKLGFIPLYSPVVKHNEGG